MLPLYSGTYRRSQPFLQKCLFGVLIFFLRSCLNIRSTTDFFKNSTPHFLDINITSDGLGIYTKDTFTGQYTNFESFVPWRHKISLVRALIDRVHQICTPNKMKAELKLITKFFLWNGFPKLVANLLIDRFTTNAQNRAPDHIPNHTSHNYQHSTIWLNIPFVGDLTTQLIKKLKFKLQRCLVNPNVDIRIKEKTTKRCFFTSIKDKKPPLSQSNVVYKFTCPGCNSSYIGKTNRTLHEISGAQYKKGTFNSHPKARVSCLWNPSTSRAQPCIEYTVKYVKCIKKENQNAGFNVMELSSNNKYIV